MHILTQNVKVLPNVFSNLNIFYIKIREVYMKKFAQIAVKCNWDFLWRKVSLISSVVDKCYLAQVLNDFWSIFNLSHTLYIHFFPKFDVKIKERYHNFSNKGTSSN